MTTRLDLWLGIVSSADLEIGGETRAAMERLAARYKRKKVVKTQDGDERIVYEYSERQVALRNRQKAERIEKLRTRIGKLRKKYKADLDSKDTATRLTALAVALMDETYERVGNDRSADENGHFGVTGWLVEHVTFKGAKATIKYTGKSGVDHVKEVTTAKVVSALRAACKGKKKADPLLCEGEECRIRAKEVNAYLKPFDITAKDIRGLHANEEMRTRLKAVRSGKLPEDKKEREKKLKDEFRKALEETAEAVGHTASTLRSQYLVPGLEEQFVKDGSVMEKLATKSDEEKQEEQAEDMVKPLPKKKPPREDLRNTRVKDEDPDLRGDKDLSLNYKDSALRVAAAGHLASRWLRLALAVPHGEDEEEDSTGRGPNPLFLEFIEEMGDAKFRNPETGMDVKLKSLSKTEKGRVIVKREFEKWLKQRKQPQSPGGPAPSGPSSPPPDDQSGKTPEQEAEEATSGKGDEGAATPGKGNGAAQVPNKDDDPDPEIEEAEPSKAPPQKEEEPEIEEDHEAIRADRVRVTKKRFQSIMKETLKSGKIPSDIQKELSERVADMSPEETEEMVKAFESHMRALVRVPVTPAIAKELMRSTAPKTDPKKKGPDNDDEEESEGDYDSTGDAPEVSDVLNPELTSSQLGTNLAKRLFVHRVIADPTNLPLAGRAMSRDNTPIAQKAEESDTEFAERRKEADAADRKRSKAAMDHYSEMDPKHRAQAVKQLIKIRDEAAAGSPMHRDAVAQLRGIGVVAMVKGEKIKGLPSTPTSLSAVAKVLHKNGKADKLLGSVEDFSSVEALSDIRDAFKELSHQEMAELTKDDPAYSTYGELLTDPDVSPVGKDHARAMLDSLFLGEIGVIDPLFRDVLSQRGGEAGSKERDELHRKTKKQMASSMRKYRDAAKSAPKKDRDGLIKSVMKTLFGSAKSVIGQVPKTAAGVLFTFMLEEGDYSLHKRTTPTPASSQMGKAASLMSSWDMTPWPEF